MYFWVFLPFFSLSAHAAAIGSLSRSADVTISAAQIRQDLGPRLSTKAVILDATHGKFKEATTRWQSYSNPKFISVVEVATVEDIVQTVKYANKKSIPILAKNGGHGWIKTLGDVKNGIQITLAGLKDITVHKNTATVQGGARTYMVRDALWAQKKYTTTGTCECTGFLGPALGGGHGVTQGSFGLAVDNFVSARVVLGNGTQINVSANEHKDLWWGLRGAGANFGIVTEVDYKVYDVPRGRELWYHETWDFPPTVIEEVFKQQNNFLDHMPANSVLHTTWYRNPSLDASSALVRVSAFYDGPKSKADPLLKPFRALKPLATDAGISPYNKLPAVVGADVNGSDCQEGGNRIGAGIYLTRFNPASQRKAYDYFNASTATNTPFSNSAVVFDGFAVQAVSKVPVDSTAMPWRNEQILISPFISYEPNPALDQQAEHIGSKIREIMQRASGHKEMRTYINYAFGNETLAELYGSQSRVAKLRDLKRKYDPQNVFRFFGPPGGLGF